MYCCSYIYIYGRVNVCMFVCTCALQRMPMRRYVGVFEYYECVCKYDGMYVRAAMPMLICMCIRVRMCMRMRMGVCAFMFVCARAILLCIYTLICICAYVCMCRYVCVCAHVRMSVYYVDGSRLVYEFVSMRAYV